MTDKRTTLGTFLLAAMLTIMASAVPAALSAQDTAPKTIDLTNIPQARVGHWDDIVYGDPKAPVEIIEFASFVCSHCGDFAVKIFPLIKAKYLDTGKARLHFRNFYNDDFDRTLAVIARCKDNEFAGKLSKDFLTNQAQWMAKGANAAEILMGIAANLGLDKTAFENCLNNQPLAAHLYNERMRFSKEYDFRGTPGVFIDGVYIGQPLWEKIDAAIQKALNK